MTYLNGSASDNISPNPRKALYWLEKSAESGNPAAAFNVGLFYAKGFGTVCNLEKAVQWMKKAARAGDEDAKKLAKEYQQAINDTTLAEKGDAAAQGRLANFYMSMAGSLQEAGTGDYYSKALKWARRAAEQGNGDGFWALALAYEHGRGVTKDVKQAVDYYTRGSEAGHARAMNSLGCYYMRGEAVQQNMKLGYELIYRAAMLGDGEAMANLGRCYQFGNGCMGNMKKAIHWYEKSLELVPDPELERKTRTFKMLTNSLDDEEYSGEDSDRKLTASEQAFLNRVERSLQGSR